MSTTKGVKIKYKGNTIHNLPGDGEFKLLTKASYLEDDLDIQVDRDANLDSKTITANGSYSAASDELDGYDEVTVNVPNSYSASDEGKVVDDGALVEQTSTTKNANGTYDTTLNSEVIVNVPNSYTQSDEGKVVSNGALVAQTSATKTANGTYDTTLNNQIVVDVSGGGGGGGSTNILHGDYAPTPSTGQNGSIYLQTKSPKQQYNILEYIRTNKNNLNITLTNWTYQSADKIIMYFKNGGSGGSGNGARLITVGEIGTGAVLDINYNTYNNRKCINVRHDGAYSGDSNYAFDGPNNTSLFYKMVMDGSDFSLYSGDALYNYNARQINQTVGNATAVDRSSPVLFKTNVATWDIVFYELEVYRDGAIIHDYFPIQGGVIDVVDGTTYLTEVQGATYGSAWQRSYIVGTSLKKNGAWSDIIGSDMNDVNVGGGNITVLKYDDFDFSNTTTAVTGDSTSGWVLSKLNSPTASSGDEQIISTKNAVDLTNVDYIEFLQAWLKTNHSSSGGTVFGVSASVPQDYAAAKNESIKITKGSGNNEGSESRNIPAFIDMIDVSSLTGSYYIWCASKVAFSSSGYIDTKFKVELN